MSERAFDKFTKRAKQVLQIATEEARAFNHPYIGTEHILLGLIKEGEGVAARVLDRVTELWGRVLAWDFETLLPAITPVIRLSFMKASIADVFDPTLIFGLICAGASGSS